MDWIMGAQCRLRLARAAREAPCARAAVVFQRLPGAVCAPHRGRHRQVPGSPRSTTTARACASGSPRCRTCSRCSRSSRSPGRPLGLAVYMRADLEHVTVLHLGLVEDYCSGGPQEGLKLLLQLGGARCVARRGASRACGASRCCTARNACALRSADRGPRRFRDATGPVVLRAGPRPCAGTAATCGPAFVAYHCPS